jgi:hypothetical protein
MIHPAFFFAESSVAVTKLKTLPAITKNRIQITKYSATFIKGYIIVLYRLSANTIQLGLWSFTANSCVIIPLFQTKEFAINLAETIIIIQIIQNITNLIPSFKFSSFSEVIILYHPKNAIAIQTTMKKSITYHISTLTCSLNSSDPVLSITTSPPFIALDNDHFKFFCVPLSVDKSSAVSYGL